jgi:hypothetical protein
MTVTGWTSPEYREDCLLKNRLQVEASGHNVIQTVSIAMLTPIELPIAATPIYSQHVYTTNCILADSDN